MNRTILIGWALLSLFPTLWAGEVQLLNTFPYDTEAFQYVLSWGDEGVSGGPQQMEFLNNKELMVFWWRNPVGIADSFTVYDLNRIKKLQSYTI